MKHAAAVTAAVVLAGAAWAAAEWSRPVQDDGGRTLLRFRAGGLVYRFDPVYRTEALFDADDRPERNDLFSSRPADAARLRARLLERLGLRSLEEIPDRDAAFREELMRNGYFPGGRR